MNRISKSSRDSFLSNSQRSSGRQTRSGSLDPIAPGLKPINSGLKLSKGYFAVSKWKRGEKDGVALSDGFTVGGRACRVLLTSFAEFWAFLPSQPQYAYFLDARPSCSWCIWQRGDEVVFSAHKREPPPPTFQHFRTRLFGLDFPVCPKPVADILFLQSKSGSSEPYLFPHLRRLKLRQAVEAAMELEDAAPSVRKRRFSVVLQQKQELPPSAVSANNLRAASPRNSLSKFSLCSRTRSIRHHRESLPSTPAKPPTTPMWAREMSINMDPNNRPIGCFRSRNNSSRRTISQGKRRRQRRNSVDLHGHASLLKQVHERGISTIVSHDSSRSLTLTMSAEEEEQKLSSNSNDSSSSFDSSCAELKDVVELSASGWERNAWHHIAVTGDRRGTWLYVDFHLKAFQENQADVQLTTPLHVGSRHNNSQRFSGVLDEMRFWDHRRTLRQLRMFKRRRIVPDMHFTGFVFPLPPSARPLSPIKGLIGGFRFESADKRAPAVTAEGLQEVSLEEWFARPHLLAEEDQSTVAVISIGQVPEEILEIGCLEHDIACPFLFPCPHQRSSAPSCFSAHSTQSHGLPPALILSPKHQHRWGNRATYAPFYGMLRGVQDAPRRSLIGDPIAKEQG